MAKLCSRKVAELIVLCMVALSDCVTNIQGFQQHQPILPSTFTRSYNRKSNYQQQPLDSFPKSSSSTTTTTTTCLHASSPPFLSAIGSPLGSVSVLAFVVLFHELGHYLAARLLGIQVEEFSVGIGPKLFGFEAFGNEFNLRGLPLGGYVRFPPNYDEEQVQELQERELQKAANTKLSKKEDNNSLVFGLLNVLTLGRLERKRVAEQKAKRLLEQQQQQQQEATNKRTWFSNLFTKSKETQQQQQDEDDKFEIEYYDDPDLLQNRPWPQRALVLSGGVIFNLLLAFLIFFGEINVGSGLPKPIFEQGAVVASLSRVQSPSTGILEPGDVIVRVNGSPLSLSQSPNAAAAQRSIGDFIERIRETPEGDSLHLSVLRPNVEQPVDISVQPQRLDGTGPQSIGVMLRPNFKNTIALKSDSIPQAAKLASASVLELTEETANGLLSFFAQVLNGKGAPAGQSVSGPIGLIRTGSTVVSTSDATAVLTFMAAISVNLAVVNSLPLPALDGGQMLFVISEAVTGRKVDQRLQEGITSVALVFLLLLSFSTTIGDVESIFRSSR